MNMFLDRGSIPLSSTKRGEYKHSKSWGMYSPLLFIFKQSSR